MHHVKRSNRRLDPRLHPAQGALGANQHLPAYDDRVRVISQSLHGVPLAPVSRLSFGGGGFVS
jgi:hypothetical protein